MRPSPLPPATAGFTILEMLVVIFVIVILAAIIVPQALKVIDEGRAHRIAGDLEALKEACHRYHMDVGSPPQESDSSASPRLDPGLADDDWVPAGHADDWDGPYLDRYPFHDALAEIEYRTIDAGHTSFDYDGTPDNWYLVHVSGIPERFQAEVDEILDDGDLSTGNLRTESSDAMDYFVGEF